MPRTQRTERPETAERTPWSRIARHPLASTSLAIAVLALALVPAAGAAPIHAQAAPLATASSASTGVWAWGAFSNATGTLQYVGAYADQINLTKGNLSSAGAFVAEAVNYHALYESYVIVNATAPTPGTRYIRTTAVAIAEVKGVIVVAGDLPKAGTYAPGSALALVNMTEFYYSSAIVVTVALGYSNYTLVNGSLSLANEQVRSWTGYNTTTIAYHWPSYVANANGTTTVSYSSAAYVALAWVATAANMTFSPALTLSKSPLSVGKTWNSTTNATVIGWSAYQTASAWTAGKTNASSSNSGVSSLNTTAKIAFSFDVVASESVIFPNGTEETGYTIAATANGAPSNAYLLWDGLLVLPAGTPAPPSALRPATALASSLPAATSAGISTRAIVGSNGFPVATAADSASGTPLSTAPIAPSRAGTAITATATPEKPVTPSLPPIQNPLATPTPTTNQPPPNNNPPKNTPPNTTPPATATPVRAKGASSPLTPALLAAIVAGITVAFLAVALVRERRRR